MAETDYHKKIIYKKERWTALSSKPNTYEVCYAVNYNISRVGNVEKSSKKPYIMVSYISPFKKRITAFFGYKLRQNSIVNLSVDGVQFTLVSYDEYAISSDYETDDKIINALRMAKKVLIRSESIDDEYSIDEYSVTGFDNVFIAMQKKCIHTMEQH